MGLAQAFLVRVGGLQRQRLQHQLSSRLISVVRAVWVLAETQVLISRLDHSSAQAGRGPRELLSDCLAFAEKYALMGVAARTRLLAAVLVAPLETVVA